MYDKLVREILGLDDPNMKPEPVFRRKSLDEIFAGKGIPRGGVASLTPILEPGSVAALNAGAEPTTAAADTGKFDFGMPSPDPGTVMEAMLERGHADSPSGPMWRRTQVIQPQAGIDTTTGAPFWDRAALSILVKPEGDASYMKARYGDESVGYSPEGELMFRSPDTNQWTLVDEKGNSWKDWTVDKVGDAIELGPTVTGGIVGGPLGAAGLNAGANVVRQIIGSALPGDSGMSFREGVLRAGISAVAGGAAKKVWDAGKAATPALRNFLDKLPKRNTPTFPVPMRPPLTPGERAAFDAIAERAAGAAASVGSGSAVDKVLNKPEARQPDKAQPGKQPQGRSPHRRRIPGP